MSQANDRHLPLPPGYHPLCAICPTPSRNVCSGCHHVRYCTPHCQQVDWPTHKLLCRQWKEFSDAHRPVKEGVRYVRTIFCPHSRARPEFMWLQVIYREEVDKESVDLGKLMGTDRQLRIDTEPITVNELVNRVLNPVMDCMFRMYFMADGSPVSQSIINITQGRMGMEWKGPVMFVGRKGKVGEEGAKYVTDLSIADLRHIADFFLFYDSKELIPCPLSEYITDVTGIQISCTGDLIINGLPLMQERAVPTEHYIRVDATLPEIPIRLGIAVFCYRLPPHRAWSGRNDRPENMLYNQLASWLFVNCNIHSDKFGTINPNFLPTTCGSVLVVRKDRKRLRAEHLDCMIQFIEKLIVPKMQSCLHTEANWYDDLLEEETEEEEKAGKLALRKKVLDYLTKDIFEEHWTRWSQNRELDDIESPFTM